MPRRTSCATRSTLRFTRELSGRGLSETVRPDELLPVERRGLLVLAPVGDPAVDDTHHGGPVCPGLVGEGVFAGSDLRRLVEDQVMPLHPHGAGSAARAAEEAKQLVAA